MRYDVFAHIYLELEFEFEFELILFLVDDVNLLVEVQ